jgi:DmsE family decaheme c-type cytochrome
MAVGLVRTSLVTHPGFEEGRAMRSSNSFRRILLVSALAGAAAMTVSRSAAQDNKPAAEPSSAAAQPAAQPEGDYVGSEVCVTCHADQEKSFVHTIMGNAMAHARTPLEKLRCEACHGPGKTHVEAGGGKDTIPVRFTKDSTTPVEERNAACLSCHTKGNQMFWTGSPHESRAMACVDCHQVHYGSPAEKYAELASVDSRYGAPLTEHVGTKKPQPELCLQCHQMRRAQLQRSSHMPYREGKVTCTSCHNPHGSSNPQLLKVRMPRVCDSCHDASRHPTQPQPLGSIKNFNRGCTNCHSLIHGSNHPSGNFFLR